MTTVSCTPIKSMEHAVACREYLDNEKTVQTAGWNVDPDRWFDEMRRTQVAYHHDVSGRVGVEPTLAYHEQLAFLPDECCMNGGRVDEFAAMSYAWKYFTNVYANQEVYMCLHNEGDRFCVHAYVGRTDLASGRRHDRGAPEALQLRRLVKDALDREYGLQHVMNLREKEQRMVYEPVRYSQVRDRSYEARAERYANRRRRSYKRQLFEDCALALSQAKTIEQYREILEGKGYAVRETKRGLEYSTKNHLGQERTFTDRAMRPARLSTREVKAGIERNAQCKERKRQEQATGESVGRPAPVHFQVSRDAERGRRQ